jgi:hypothetical protein
MVYVPANNTLQWDVGDGVVDVSNSSLRETLGLQQGLTYTSTFTTRLFLAAPMNIDFISPQLQTSYYSYSGRAERESNVQPLISVPVLSGYGQMSVYLPSTLTQLDTGGTQFGQLNFKVVDSLTGDDLTEIGHWSMQIECYTGQ